MKVTKFNRVVNCFNPGGIAGVDNPLRDDTLYYKKNLD